MRKSRFSEERIIKILKENEAGATLADLRPFSIGGRRPGPTRAFTAPRSGKSPRCLPRNARRCRRCRSEPVSAPRIVP
jgi:hypothetical protein